MAETSKTRITKLRSRFIRLSLLARQGARVAMSA
jgi:hypothetical protein